MQSIQIEFQTDLITRRAPPGHPAPWLKGRGPRRELVEDFVVTVYGVGVKIETITVPAGYVFDGSSIPWFLWWLFPPGYDPAWRAAAVHDFLYSHLWETRSKSYADDVFEAIMLEDGASKLVASAFHSAVSCFGKGGW